MASRNNFKNISKDGLSNRVNVGLKPMSSETFQCEPLFKVVEETLKTEGPKYVSKVKAVFAFNVTDGPGGKKEKWVIDVKNGRGSVRKADTGKADCIITIKDKDLADIIRGKLQAQSAFFTGKLKVSGSMGVAMKLQQIMPKTLPAKL